MDIESDIARLFTVGTRSGSPGIFDRIGEYSPKIEHVHELFALLQA
jgi:hypothetical protein